MLVENENPLDGESWTQDGSFRTRIHKLGKRGFEVKFDTSGPEIVPPTVTVIDWPTDRLVEWSVAVQIFHNSGFKALGVDSKKADVLRSLGAPSLQSETDHTPAWIRYDRSGWYLRFQFQGEAIENVISAQFECWSPAGPGGISRVDDSLAQPLDAPYQGVGAILKNFGGAVQNTAKPDETQEPPTGSISQSTQVTRTLQSTVSGLMRQEASRVAAFQAFFGSDKVENNDNNFNVIADELNKRAHAIETADSIFPPELGETGAELQQIMNQQLAMQAMAFEAMRQAAFTGAENSKEEMERIVKQLNQDKAASMESLDALLDSIPDSVKKNLEDNSRQ